MINLKKIIFVILISIPLISFGESTLSDILTPSISENFDPNTELNKFYKGCPIVKVPSKRISSSCRSKTNPQIRTFFKSYFNNLSRVQKNAQRVRLSKLMGMMIKESSGNPAAVADMKGNGSSTSYRTFFKVNNSKGVMSSPHYANTKLVDKLIEQKGIAINKQTNFGLAQLSADRLDIPKWGGNYLSSKIKDIKKMSSETFFSWCATSTLYSDSKTTLKRYFLKNIKNCSMNSKTTAGIKCFAKTINLCPRMTVELALQQPMRYFETKNAKPLCPELFN